MTQEPMQVGVPPVLTVRAAAEQFLDSLESPNTVRAYRIAVLRTIERIDTTEGPHRERPLATLTSAEVGHALESLWAKASVNTWNARRAAVGAWLRWCDDQGWPCPTVPRQLRRATPPLLPVAAVSAAALDALTSRTDVHLREKTLWWMIFETCSHPRELLAVDIETLELPERRCPAPGRSGEHAAARAVAWGPRTAALLPLLIGDRTRGPLFVTHRRGRRSRVLPSTDVSPETGRARLSYNQARHVLETVTDGRGAGWKLHNLRHSGLAHLAASGCEVSDLMVKAGPIRPTRLGRYLSAATAALEMPSSTPPPREFTHRLTG
ncbi:site-specific integrase [Nocardia yunnanensis]|uniref:Site-specific integrase n=1 Tax=Nocardia yunnanensis TaxID=2382165 RepID=A0A386ZK06_9NOCA|nr:site-specific integrase [Nocardia yunnanensis]AYF77748.1 site-specific integrase [Nocardia yunnanensis]